MLLILLRGSIFLYVPIIGRWKKTRLTADMFMLLGLQMRGGVPIDVAIENLTVLGSNYWINRTVKILRGTAARGEHIGDVFYKTRIVPKDYSAPLAIAGKTKDFPKALIQVGEDMQLLAQMKIENTVKTLEPIIVLTIALTVGLFIISMYMPIFFIPGVIK
jgi:type IV pilus assembly protein PilC